MGLGTWWKEFMERKRRMSVTHAHYLERRSGRKVEYELIRLKNGRFIESGNGTLPRMSGRSMTGFGTSTEDCAQQIQRTVARFIAEGYVEAEPPMWWLRSSGEPPDTAEDPSGFYEDPDHHDLDKYTEERTWTHTGMYVVWLDTQGLLGPLEDEADQPLLEQVRVRAITPGAFFGGAYRGWLASHNLSQAGDAFSHTYYKDKGYKADYKAHLLEPRQNFYAVADTWENFDRLKPVLDERFAAWKEAQAL